MYIKKKIAVKELSRMRALWPTIIYEVAISDRTSAPKTSKNMTFGKKQRMRSAKLNQQGKTDEDG